VRIVLALAADGTLRLYHDAGQAVQVELANEAHPEYTPRPQAVASAVTTDVARLATAVVLARADHAPKPEHDQGGPSQ
jgi:hypothetical protein